MADEFLRHWKALESDSEFTAPKEIIMRTTAFERKIRNRNLREFFAGAIAIPVYLWLAWDASQAGAMVKAAGWIVSLAGMAFVMVQLFRRGSNLPRQPEQDSLTHLKAQLSHQRDVLRSVGRWYLAPLLPGLAIVFLANAWDRASSGEWWAAAGIAALQLILIAVVFGFVLRLNLRAANKLESELVSLDNSAHA
ncbi:hypothetical protein OAS19_04960 [Altererythrobacter sp.]|nr:hypothetical protein [Altererythrobacter sp.]